MALDLDARLYYVYSRFAETGDEHWAGPFLSEGDASQLAAVRLAGGGITEVISVPAVVHSRTRHPVYERSNGPDDGTKQGVA